MKDRVLFVSAEGLSVIASKKKKISNDRTLFLKAVWKKSHFQGHIYKYSTVSLSVVVKLQ